MAVKHQIRTEDGKLKTVKLTARQAILAHCRECMGFASYDVRGCTSPNCPLFPFRTLDTPKDTV